jgi:hypothetical protein
MELLSAASIDCLCTDSTIVLVAKAQKPLDDSMWWKLYTPLCLPVEVVETHETLYRHGQRISLRVEEQMGQMLTDIAKQTEPTTQQQLRRGQNRKAEISSDETWDNFKRHHNEGTNEEREDELRQGRRVYEIQGTRQAGHILNLWNTHRIGGKIQMTEQETPSQGNGDLEEQTLDCLTDKYEPDSCEALVDFWAGISQDEKQEADTATATDSTQSDAVKNTAATSES